MGGPGDWGYPPKNMGGRNVGRRVREPKMGGRIIKRPGEDYPHSGAVEKDGRIIVPTLDHKVIFDEVVYNNLEHLRTMDVFGSLIREREDGSEHGHLYCNWISGRFNNVGLGRQIHLNMDSQGADPKRIVSIDTFLDDLQKTSEEVLTRIRSTAVYWNFRAYAEQIRADMLSGSGQEEAGNMMHYDDTKRSKR